MESVGQQCNSRGRMIDYYRQPTKQALSCPRDLNYHFIYIFEVSNNKFLYATNVLFTFSFYWTMKIAQIFYRTHCTISVKVIKQLESCCSESILILHSVIPNKLNDLLASNETKNMLLLVISCGVIVVSFVGFLIALNPPKKSLRQLYAEVRYEIVYNIIGSTTMLEDMLNKKHNKAEVIPDFGGNALITGGTRGIGVEVIKMLLQCDMNVIIGCRKVQDGEELFKQIRKEGLETGDMDVFELDISSLNSVLEFAEKIKEKYNQLNILINNAGIMYVPYNESKDGYESQFATNYLGHASLTHKLLPLLESAGNLERKARIVNVSSCAYLSGKIFFDDINNKEKYIPFQAYSQSKLAQILFSNELNKKLNESKRNVQSYAIHPGVVNTDLFRDTYIKMLAPWMCRIFFKTPKEGAMTIVYTAISDKMESKGGTYISNCQIQTLKDFARDEHLQRRLFTFTENLLGVTDFCEGK